MIFCVILAGVIVYVSLILPLQRNYNAHHVDIHGLYLLHPLKIKNLELVDQNGKPFTKENLQNHWSLLFFGFTHCDIICPMTLSALTQFYKNINNNPFIQSTPKNIPQIVFVTIDPDKDTAARLKTYLGQFNSGFIGARTSWEKTLVIKEQFHILAEKANTASDQYNHSTEILLINPAAEIQAYFYFPHNPAQLEKDYLAILKKLAT